MKKVKIITSIVVLIVIVIIVLRINNNKNSLGKVKKISQKRCKEAFNILEQIQSALIDKNRLSIAETSWLVAINNL